MIKPSGWYNNGFVINALLFDIVVSDIAIGKYQTFFAQKMVSYDHF